MIESFISWRIILQYMVLWWMWTSKIWQWPIKNEKRKDVILKINMWIGSVLILMTCKAKNDIPQNYDMELDCKKRLIVRKITFSWPCSSSKSLCITFNTILFFVYQNQSSTIVAILEKVLQNLPIGTIGTTNWLTQKLLI